MQSDTRRLTRERNSQINDTVLGFKEGTYTSRVVSANKCSLITKAKV